MASLKAWYGDEIREPKTATKGKLGRPTAAES
jgi:hypothetical protein